MKCYKVVRTFKEKYFSALATGIFKREYALGKTTVAPEGTGLLVFDSLKAAKRFSAGELYVVFEAEGTGEVELPGSCAWYALESDYISVWRGTHLKFLDNRWPSGTLAFKKVRLIRLVV